MVRYVGLDVHKRFIEFCVLDRAGKKIARGRVVCERQALEAFARETLSRSDHVALEASTNTWSVVAILRPHVARLVVSNPMRTKAIAEAKIKTDKVDAEVLAQLLRCDYLPSVWQPDDQTQQLRRLTTQRATLSADRVRIKNRIQSLLAQLLLTPPGKCLWTKAGMAWLKDVQIPATERFLLTADLRLLETVSHEFADLDKALAEVAYQEDRVRLLMTLPGVSYTTGVGLLSALGDITRFRDGDHAAAYLGLTPSIHQSGKHCYHGHITKAGSNHARWLLTQSMQHIARHPGPLGVFFRRLAHRKNRNVAIVAVARKLVTIAFLMLKNNEPYRYAQPALVRSKFSTLRYRATGIRAKSTTNKAVPKVCLPSSPANLNDIYESAGLKPSRTLDHLPPGERRMLQERKVDQFVAGLNQSKPRPRSRAKPIPKSHPA
jgi:transposase